MRPHIDTLEAMLYCKYKAWQLAKEINEQPDRPNSNHHPVAVLAWQLNWFPDFKVKSPNQQQQAKQLLADAPITVDNQSPPTILQNPALFGMPI